MVEVEDGKLIRADDMVIPGDPPALADVVEVEAREEPASILDRAVKPRRRLTEKSGLTKNSSTWITWKPVHRRRWRLPR